MSSQEASNSKEVWRRVDDKSADYFALSDRIWHMPELNYQEIRSAAEHRAMLEHEGFRVTDNVAGLPTALIGMCLAVPVMALVFIGLPFVVRTVQPIMEEMDREVEEAAATLGASRFQTITRVLFPGLAPAIVTGFALAFARGVGEYGSVIFIAGNLPYKSEIAPLLIVIRLEEYNYPAATAIAAVMLGLSFLMLLVVNLAQSWSRKRYG